MDDVDESVDDEVPFTRLLALSTPTSRDPCEAIPDGTCTNTAGSMIDTVINDPLEKILLNDLSKRVYALLTSPIMKHPNVALNSVCNLKCRPEKYVTTYPDPEINTMIGNWLHDDWLISARPMVNSGTSRILHAGWTLDVQLVWETAPRSIHPYNAAPNVIPNDIINE
ncbi:hypothetical protein OGAPHI_005691 [Ogataea philodendri]|uniref:Uncharacterized protein n=1 Tax=Ogataea philodendri TaxID=1378263 RepID=A0A9P8NZQ1_9ASCO|nr:uncharacterized protein OGAPHI_005691 [Ogataea philodendri]KAH3662439.1 hypothetical protein OGAPHI_005691 [Ogataea philodendri]